MNGEPNATEYGKLRDIWDYAVVGFLKLGIPFWGRHSILGSHWGP